MRKCKSCIQEIDEKASKCPYCQSFQTWYKNPQNYSLIVLIPLIIYIWFSSGLFSNTKYQDHIDQFSTTEVSTANINGNMVHTYKVTNNTDETWSSANYELIALDESGKVLIALTGIEYGWVVQPNSSTMMSVTVKQRIKAAKWQFKITNMRHERY